MLSSSRIYCCFWLATRVNSNPESFQSNEELGWLEAQSRVIFCKGWFISASSFCLNYSSSQPQSKVLVVYQDFSLQRVLYSSFYVFSPISISNTLLIFSANFSGTCKCPVLYCPFISLDSPVSHYYIFLQLEVFSQIQVINCSPSCAFSPSGTRGFLVVPGPRTPPCLLYYFL